MTVLQSWRPRSRWFAPPAPAPGGEFHQFYLHGQSHIVGQTFDDVDGDPINTTQPNNNILMLNTGTRWDAAADHISVSSTSGITSLVNLIEAELTNTQGQHISQTIAFSMMRWITDIATAAGTGAAKYGLVNHAMGGRSVTQLNKRGTGSTISPTVPYTDGFNAHTKMRDLQKAAYNLTYKGKALAWVQGESDQWSSAPNPSDPGLYLRRVYQLFSDYQTDVRALLGAGYEAFVLPIFIQQGSVFNNSQLHQVNKKPWIATEQLRLAMQNVPAGYTNSKPILVTPAYMFPYAKVAVGGTAGANFHPTAAGYQYMGEFFGKAIGETLYNNNPWKPILPKSMSRTGATITMTFDNVGPSDPLVFDTTHVDDPNGFKGFACDVTIAGATTQDVAFLNQPTIVNNDTVQIVLAANPGASADVTLRYAFSSNGNTDFHGPHTTAPAERGNLRATNAPSSKFGNDPIYRWCPHFCWRQSTNYLYQPTPI